MIILVIITVILLFVLLLFMLSPLEALSWWAGWMKSEPPEETQMDLQRIVNNRTNGRPDGVEQYVIFMTGIGGFSQTAFLPEERLFMDKLMAAMPSIKLVDDVYPYTTMDTGLTEGRVFARVWRYAVEQKANGSIVGFTVNLRNLLQVLVAADSRYGPIYGWGLANILLRALDRHEYPFGSGIPITLIGYSGGGEMSLESVKLLNAIVQVPVRVISLGGVVSNDVRNLQVIDHLYHIYGDRDKIQRIGALLFPGRWRFVKWSAWNRTKADGRITLVHIGDFTHNGPNGYLDHEAHVEDGRSHIDVTIDTIADLLRQNPHIGAVKEAAPASA